MLVRATTKSYTQVAAEIVGIIRQSAPGLIDQSIRSYYVSQTAEAKYWPDDDELRYELIKMPIYPKSAVRVFEWCLRQLKIMNEDIVQVETNTRVCGSLKRILG